MAIEVAFSEDPRWVLAEAEVFLASEPVLHNLILVLLGERLAYPEPGRYWLAKDGESVVGVVFQSPLDFAATLTPMGPEAVAGMIDTIVGTGVIPDRRTFRFRSAPRQKVFGQSGRMIREVGPPRGTALGRTDSCTLEGR